MLLKPPKGVLLNRSHPLAKGLVGCWLMNDAPPLLGKTLDLSGHRNNGTLVGDTSVVPGKFGSCLSFDGTGDYMSISGITIPAGSNFSLSLWMYPESWGPGSTRPGFFRNGTNSTGNNYWLQDEVGSDRIWVKWNGTDILKPTSGYTRPLNEWAHLVLTVRSANDVHYYVNGENKHNATHAVTTVSFTIYNLFTQWYMGESLDGSIDNVMIYNRALNVGEIQQLFYDPFCMFQQEPIELWTAATSGGVISTEQNAIFFGCNF
jgi:hypothetical protein